MTDSDRETRDLLIEIRTMLGVVVTKGEDHELRLRQVEQTAVTKEELAEERAAADARTKRVIGWAGVVIAALSLIIPTGVSVVIALLIG